jgi:PknH-like extracellular domain
VGYGEDSWTYNFSDVQFHGDVSSVSMAAGSTAEVGGRACQTAIGLRANVVVETWTCLWANFPYFPATPADPNEAGDYAVQLVTAMLGKVKV